MRKSLIIGLIVGILVIFPLASAQLEWLNFLAINRNQPEPNILNVFLMLRELLQDIGFDNLIVGNLTVTDNFTVHNLTTLNDTVIEGTMTATNFSGAVACTDIWGEDADFCIDSIDGEDVYVNETGDLMTGTLNNFQSSSGKRLFMFFHNNASTNNGNWSIEQGGTSDYNGQLVFSTNSNDIMRLAGNGVTFVVSPKLESGQSLSMVQDSAYHVSFNLASNYTRIASKGDLVLRTGGTATTGIINGTDMHFYGNGQFDDNLTVSGGKVSIGSKWCFIEKGDDLLITTGC